MVEFSDLLDYYWGNSKTLHSNITMIHINSLGDCDSPRFFIPALPTPRIFNSQFSIHSHQNTGTPSPHTHYARECSPQNASPIRSLMFAGLFFASLSAYLSASCHLLPNRLHIPRQCSARSAPRNERQPALYFARSLFVHRGVQCSGNQCHASRELCAIALSRPHSPRVPLVLLYNPFRRICNPPSVNSVFAIRKPTLVDYKSPRTEKQQLLHLHIA